MSQEFFDLGCRGCSEANVSRGLPNISAAILKGWVADSSDNNIERAGHRWWILRPDGLSFGIGYAQNGGKSPISNMYVFSNGGQDRPSDSYVAWPSSGDFPIQYFIANEDISTVPRYP